MKLELTMFNTAAIAILILFLGSYVKSKIEILRKEEFMKQRKAILYMQMTFIQK